jgi:hypothetical protein
MIAPSLSQASEIKSVSNFNNLNIYIPRINDSHTEASVKQVFSSCGIGLVEYVDFVAKKDPETKKLLFYSAFVKLTEWNSNWFYTIFIGGLNKIPVSSHEFWLILIAKNTISRSKVNTHQLASYTDELFVRVEEIEKSAVENITVSSTHFKNLLAKSEAQASQIDQLLKIVADQSNQLNRINKLLFEEQPATRERTLTIEDLDSEEWSPSICENCGMEFDMPKELGFHSTVCKPKSEEKKTVYCEDECFFFKPLQNHVERVSPTTDIIRGSFTLTLEDVIEPLAKSVGLPKEEVKKGLEKEWSNSTRAKSSSSFCGNE